MAGEFDAEVSFHLVLPTLGIVVAFDSGTFVAFPSALIPHGNLHGGVNFEVWQTRKGHPFLPGGVSVHGQVRRGSVVWFSQGNIIRRGEKGMGASELRSFGLDTNSGFDLDIFRTSLFA